MPVPTCGHANIHNECEYISHRTTEEGVHSLRWMAEANRLMMIIILINIHCTISG
jgi:hypothetical protein